MGRRGGAEAAVPAVLQSRLARPAVAPSSRGCRGNAASRCRTRGREPGDQKLHQRSRIINNQQSLTAMNTVAITGSLVTPPSDPKVVDSNPVL